MIVLKGRISIVQFVHYTTPLISKVQCAAAVGIGQLKKYDAERAEIEKAMLYYWKQLRYVVAPRGFVV